MNQSEMNAFVEGFAATLDAEAKRIEREKDLQPLSPEEAKTLKARHFLGQIAPYLFRDTPPEQP